VTRRSHAALLLLLLLAGSEAAAQLAPPSTGGVGRLDAVLQQLAEPRRVLIIGAHPDDEDTSLLTLMARGFGADAAYLALSRGEGGQNLLGPELGVALGLLRSRELEAARAIDGAQQFFTRAYDFGYTRSLEETERHWLPDSILKDVVRIVRRFRPHVLVSVFSGTVRDGHGQHQLSGVLARRAFVVAGDSTVFPELRTQEGLAPWTPLKLYRSTRFDSAATTLVAPTGALDPHTGNTYHQLAMASRSQHRSQDFGVLQPTGPAHTRFARLENRVALGADTEIFDGIARDSSWIALFADSLRRHLAPASLHLAAPSLAAALRRAHDAGLPRWRVRLLEEALGIAAGLVLDATAADADFMPGQSVAVRVDLYNGGPYEMQLDRIAFVPSWRRDTIVVATAGSSESEWLPGERLPPGAVKTVRATQRLDPATSLSQPYFLQRPRRGALYDWSGAASEERGLPFDAPLLRVIADVRIAGVAVEVSREVTHRLRDQAIGEIRKPLRVLPAIDVKLAPNHLVWSSAGNASQTLTVTLTSNAPDTLEGTVELSIDGWPVPDALAFRLSRTGERRSFPFAVRRPLTVDRATVFAQARARTTDGRVFDNGVEEITYSHIRPTSWIRPAQSDIAVAPIVLPSVGIVGYVRGASDRVPEALRRLGVTVRILDGDALAREGLATYAAIVVGSRAYETDSALVRHNDRLLDYVRQGGLLLVQYQQYQFVRGGFTPYPLEIARPHDRVTDETAPVKMLDATHQAFVRPNVIGADDWDGWPQERGLYFARTWDDAYRPLLEMADPGGPVLRGGLLIASYGEGTYIYTGLSFFRALPEGVPGAFRLFLNLLALGTKHGQ
jgi:LmbE family N-acetylglucosaminyl deacetylase